MSQTLPTALPYVNFGLSGSYGVISQNNNLIKDSLHIVAQFQLRGKGRKKNCFPASGYDLWVTDVFHTFNFLALQMSLFHFLFIKIVWKSTYNFLTPYL